MEPDVPSSVAYRHMQEGQPSCVKLPGVDGITWSTPEAKVSSPVVTKAAGGIARYR
jgi:hypothetical protein